jgi:hypothetical protein
MSSSFMSYSNLGDRAEPVLCVQVTCEGCQIWIKSGGYFKWPIFLRIPSFNLHCPRLPPLSPLRRPRHEFRLLSVFNVAFFSSCKVSCLLLNWELRQPWPTEADNFHVAGRTIRFSTPRLKVLVHHLKFHWLQKSTKKARYINLPSIRYRGLTPASDPANGIGDIVPMALRQGNLDMWVTPTRRIFEVMR